ncbi:MAG: CcoQ/FixQ family Cbb3-type cytochrome c oxidase assembly chaperone [Myxococcales bacterium]
MYRQFYAGMAFEYLPLFALLLFLSVFVANAVRLLRRRPADFEPLARLPLADSCENEGALGAAPVTERGTHG